MEYTHCCRNCAYQWDQEYSIKADPPSLCPNCQTEGQVYRLIFGGSGRGIVELTGQDLKNSIFEDAKKFKKEIYSNENTYANFVGEEKYNSNQSQMDKAKAERPSFRSSSRK